MFRSLLPQSLITRIFLLLAVAVGSMLIISLSLFYRMQFVQQIEDAQDTASMLIEVAAQAVEESAVIGDYDTVKRTIAKTLVRSPFKSGAFIDMSGGVIRLQAPYRELTVAPAWIQSRIDAQLFEVNRPINVGGRDYGVMRLSFDTARIAAQLWEIIFRAFIIAVIGLFAALVPMVFLLKRWLGHLGNLDEYEAEIVSGVVTAEAVLVSDAPKEIQDAFKAVNRTAASIRSQFGQRIDFLMNSLVQHKQAMDEAAIVSEIDVDGRITYVNQQFIVTSGYSADELIGLHIDQVGQSASFTPAGIALQKEVWQGEVMLVGRKGDMQWRRRTIMPILESGGDVEKYICIDIDISDRKQFENTILANARKQSLIASFGQKALDANDVHELGHAAVATAASGLEILFSSLLLLEDGNQGIILNAGVGWGAEMIGQRFVLQADRLRHTPGPAYTGIALPGQGDAGFKLIGRGFLPPDLVNLFSLRDGREVEIFAGDRLIGAIGVYSGTEHSFGADDLDFLQTLANMLATAIERLETKGRLTNLSRYDQLTSLPNRTRLVDCLEQAVRIAEATPSNVTVMFIDLDRFKNVNDTIGHAAGDDLLVQASRRLEGCLRSDDIVARLGGDEFAIVMLDAPTLDCIEVVAEKVIVALSEPFHLQGHQVFLSASVGIATYPQDGLTPQVLIQNADTAMYGAKNLGRNNYQHYLPAMNENALKRSHMENLLRGALGRNEFFLNFQPKVDLSNGSISGFEALLRWRDADQGLVPPADFIPILEETGLIINVGEWVIKEVCEVINCWERNGVELHPIAINLSARQFQQKGLAQVVQGIIEDSGVDPRLLEFELTESMLMSDPEAAVLSLTTMKSLGIRLSIDDFGTGYSSLAYLKRFPLDALKIDRAFIQDLPADAEDTAITVAVIALAHSLNLKVIAEGVETHEQMRMLARHGCDEMQGYYFSKPMDVDSCTSMISGGIRMMTEADGGEYPVLLPHRHVGMSMSE
jgi:diguanylate cyclase (GGDEF)-like protein/PAS domain S-box-containing protein